MTGGDFGIALIIAIVIILIYFFLFPGLYKIKTYNLEGYWSDELNKLYKLIPISDRNFHIVSSDGIFNGNVFNISSIYIDFGQFDLKGNLENSNRFINWSNGNIWTKQAF